MLLTCVHAILDFLAVSTDGQRLRLQHSDRGERSEHITVLFRPSQGVQSNHTETISPHRNRKDGRSRRAGFFSGMPSQMCFNILN